MGGYSVESCRCTCCGACGVSKVIPPLCFFDAPSISLDQQSAAPAHPAPHHLRTSLLNIPFQKSTACAYSSGPPNSARSQTPTGALLQPHNTAQPKANLRQDVLPQFRSSRVSVDTTGPSPNPVFLCFFRERHRRGSLRSPPTLTGCTSLTNAHRPISPPRTAPPPQQHEQQ